MVAVESAGPLTARLRRLCRRVRQGVGLGVERAGDAALRPADGKVRELQVLQRHGERSADPRPQGRSVGAGIRRGQARRLPNALARKRAPCGAPLELERASRYSFSPTPSLSAAGAQTCGRTARHTRWAARSPCWKASV